MSAAPHCFSAQRTAQPLYYERSDSPHFSYAFKIFPSPRPAATTVIVMNGGPGATLLDATPHETAADGAPNFPLGAVTTSRFNVIYTDHRGSGCNRPAEGDFPDDAMTTEHIALDVVSIIENLGLDDYMLFGNSFGTVEAAYITRHLVERGLPLPKAVVLEGTLGESFHDGFEEYLSNYELEWQRIKERLPAEAVRRLDEDDLPFEHTKEVWGTFIQGSLLLGEHPAAGHPSIHYLTPLATGDPTGLAVLEAGLDATESMLNDPEKRRDLLPRVGDVFFCQELFGDGARQSALDRGHLVPAGPNRCDDIAGEYRPFDSRAFTIPVPIYYFQGANDPATPVYSARIHYDGQRSTYRALSTVRGAGHGPLTTTLRTLGCSDAIWAAIDQQNATAFAAGIAACAGYVTLEGKSPGQ